MPKKVLPLIAFALLMGIPVAQSLGSVPNLAFNTVLPGYYLSSGQGLVIDAAGNSYLYAKHYPDGQTLDFLVAKLDPQGGRLWTKLITTSGHDWATGIILDNDGNVLVTGWTSAADFPVTPDAIDKTLTGFRDAFLMRLSASDGSILYCTLLGGDYTDEGRGIALDPDGNIVIAGSTWSTDFPVLDPIQAEPNGYPYQTSDLFVTRIAADGSAILQSTYLGGRLDDEMRGLAIDAQGRIWIAGTTKSDDMPVINAFQSAMHTDGDCFVQRLNAACDAVEFGTYLGGYDSESICAVAVGPSGDLYLAGTTSSYDFPTTIGSYEDTFVGAIRGCETYNGGYYDCSDMWAARISPANALVFSTFLGGTREDVCTNMAVDAAGRVHLVGYTFSSDFPPHGISGGSSLVVVGLSGLGSVLEYQAGIFSGSLNAGHGIAVDRQGGVYVTGAINVPADVFVAKFIPAQVADTPPGRETGGAAIASIAPNPFNPRTVITYNLTDDSAARLDIYDGRGRLVRTLRERNGGIGSHEAFWDGADARGRQVGSGVYFARLQAGRQIDTQRMMLIR